MLPASSVARFRKETIERIFWDTCKLLPAIGTGRTITPAGSLSQTPAAYRTYSGLEDIPCRVDLSRGFRPGETKYEAVVIDNYNLELPWDVTIEEDDTVVIGTEKFEIRKLKVASVGDITREALIFHLGGMTPDD